MSTGADVRGAMFDEFVLGGLIDDADVTIKQARFTQWDYSGKVQQPVLALQLVMVDTDGNEHEQYLSSGDLRFFVPSGDGRKAVPVGQQQKLNINTNAVAFLISLMNADTRGDLAKRLRGGDDIGVLDGTRVHIIRKAQPKRAGIIQQAGPEGQQREKTQLLVERILSYPWEAASPQAPAQRPAGAPAQAQATPPASGTGAGPTPASNNGGAGSVDDTAQSVLVQILAENGGAIKKGALAGKVFTNAEMKAAQAPTRNAVLGRIVQDAFLEQLMASGAGIQFNKATGDISLG